VTQDKEELIKSLDFSLQLIQKASRYSFIIKVCFLVVYSLTFSYFVKSLTGIEEVNSSILNYFYICPLVLFSLFDAHYLREELMFKEVFRDFKKSISNNKLYREPFQLEPSRQQRFQLSLLNALFSKSVGWFYFPLLLIFQMVILFDSQIEYWYLWSLLIILSFGVMGILFKKKKVNITSRKSVALKRPKAKVSSSVASPVDSSVPPVVKREKVAKEVEVEPEVEIPIIAPKKKVHFSFHFENDAMRAEQVRRMELVDADIPETFREWANVKSQGKEAIEEWINLRMKNINCLVVLIGAETFRRPWVKYEIKKACKDKKGLIGIYIHNLEDSNITESKIGINPFDKFIVNKNGRKLSSIVRSYDPDPLHAYSDIARNLESWVKKAIKDRG
jgi:hypothetical protein